MKILEPQYGENFVGRDYEIQQLKMKIRRNGVVIVTGDRGIGKTNLMKNLKEFFKNETMCYYLENGSLFSVEKDRFFKPEKTTTGLSSSIGILGIGGGAGKNWKQREPSILESMEKSKEKIFFIEDADSLNKEEVKIILAAISRNNRLKFVFEIARHYLPDFEMKISSDQIVELQELKDADIKITLKRACPSFSESVLERIVFLSKGYPYIARSLAYICDTKYAQDKMLEFLSTLRDDDLNFNHDKIHAEVLGTLEKNGQSIIKKIALAPQVLTLDLIGAFCGEEIDAEFSDIIERGILKFENEFYCIYHPLFRDYLRRNQRFAMKKENIKRIYKAAMEEIKANFDSMFILYDALNEPDLFNELIEITENYDVLSSCGSKCRMLAKFDQAILSFSQILKKSKDKKWEAIAFEGIGNVFQIKGELDKAIEHFEKSLKINEELDHKGEIANNYGNMGIVYQIKGELDKAIEHFEKSLKINEELERKEGMANDYGNMGIIYLEKRDIDKAIEYHKKSLKINKELEHTEDIAKDYANIGTVYNIKGEHDKAIEHYEKSLKMNEEFGFKVEIANQYGNIGNVYLIKEELDKANEFYEKSLKINEELELKVGISIQCGNMGIVCKRKGELDKAIEYYEKSLKINKELNRKRGMATNIVNMGDVYHIKGELDKALDYYLEAQDLAIDSPSLFKEVNRRVNLLLGVES